jgi:hypothetical protein
MYLRTCKSFKSVNHKKDRVRKSKIRKLQHLRKAANLTNYLSPYCCGFGELICGLPTFGLYKDVSAL